MKNRIYVLVMSLLMSVGLLAQMEEPFQSTSTFTGSGSNYSSQISTVGATDVPYSATTTEDTETHSGRTSRKSWGGGSATDPGYADEDHSPIGEPLVLLLFAAAAAGVVYLRRKEAR